VRVGKNRYFFPSSAEKIKLGPRVEAWQGFFASVRPTYKELMVNVYVSYLFFSAPWKLILHTSNVCMSAFVQPGNLADALNEFAANSRGAMPTLPNSMKRIKIKTKHLGHKKPIYRVGTTSARNTKFPCEELGGVVSVEQYFQKSASLDISPRVTILNSTISEYQIKLKYPTDLPVIDIGSKKKTIWVPAELCDILPGQPVGKLNDNETRQMIRFACNRPAVNAQSIIGQGFPTLGLNPVQSPINGFGVSIDSEMAVIPARELLPPRLSYRVGKAEVRNGGWNILDVKFHRGGTVNSWWVLVVRDGYGKVQGPQDPNLASLVEGFARKCKNSGMTMPEGRPRLLPVALPHPNTDPTRANAIQTIRSTLKGALQTTNNRKPSFVLVLLENRDNFIYPGLKVIHPYLVMNSILTVSTPLAPWRRRTRYPHGVHAVGQGFRSKRARSVFL
jgi:hypothetical protein